MSNPAADRVMKNTFVLYIRMFFMMVVSLYTSRVILKNLGAENYGIYSLVGGVVTMFSFLQATISNSAQRFLTFELGKNDRAMLKRTFCMLANIHFGVAVLIVIILETAGLWFFYQKLFIPADRLSAAFWVYQFSVLTMFFNVITTHYNGVLIAHENMGIYAYIDILGTVLKLLLVLLLPYINADRLILFAFFIFLISWIQRVIYSTYCRRKYEEARFEFIWDAGIYKKLIGFSGWLTISALSNITLRQGVNILVNMFYGVLANAAIGIASQVNNTINKFATNFQQAYVPQLVKSYAEGNFERTKKYIFSGAKICCILLGLFSIPIIIEAPVILKLWLKNVPEYTVMIVRLILLDTLVRSITYSMQSAIRATGRIRNFEITNNLILFSGLISGYFLMKSGGSVYSIFYIQILFSIISSFYIAYTCARKIMFSYRTYFRQVILRMFVIITISSLPAIYLHHVMEEGFIRLMVILAAFLAVYFPSLYICGFTTTEKELIKQQIIQKFKR